MTRPDAHIAVFADKQSLSAGAGEHLLTALLAAQDEHDGPVHLVLTGGSMGSAILASLGQVAGEDAVDWDRLHLWWGDERYLPAGDPDRNQTQNFEALFNGVPIPADNVHAVAGPDTSATAEDSAHAYATAVRTTTEGTFDITLLGVGPDGHIASLFPHHPAQRITDEIAIAVHDSPKPPPDRVSLTYDALNRSRHVIFIVSGGDKAPAVARALDPGADRWDVPASGVQGEDSTTWLLDAAAASDLSIED